MGMKLNWLNRLNIDIISLFIRSYGDCTSNENDCEWLAVGLRLLLNANPNSLFFFNRITQNEHIVYLFII